MVTSIPMAKNVNLHMSVDSLVILLVKKGPSRMMKIRSKGKILSILPIDSGLQKPYNWPRIKSLIPPDLAKDNPPGKITTILLALLNNNNNPLPDRP